MKKKGISLNNMAAVGLAFVLVGVILGMGAYINDQIVSTAGWSVGDTARNAVDNATVGIGTLGQWLPIIAVVIAAGIVLAILVSAFSRRGV